VDSQHVCTFFNTYLHNGRATWITTCLCQPANAPKFTYSTWRSSRERNEFYIQSRVFPPSAGGEDSKELINNMTEEMQRMVQNRNWMWIVALTTAALHHPSEIVLESRTQFLLYILPHSLYAEKLFVKLTTTSFNCASKSLLKAPSRSIVLSKSDSLLFRWAKKSASHTKILSTGTLSR